MPAVYEHHHTVADDEIDALGHANNVAYLQWMQGAAVAHSAAQGWPGDRYRQFGFGWVVRAHTIEYSQPALRGEEIVVRRARDFFALQGYLGRALPREEERAAMAKAAARKGRT